MYLVAYIKTSNLTQVVILLYRNSGLGYQYQISTRHFEEGTIQAIFSLTSMYNLLPDRVLPIIVFTK